MAFTGQLPLPMDLPLVGVGRHSQESVHSHCLSPLPFMTAIDGGARKEGRALHCHQAGHAAPLSAVTCEFSVIPVLAQFPLLYTFPNSSVPNCSSAPNFAPLAFPADHECPV